MEKIERNTNRSIIALNITFIIIIIVLVFAIFRVYSKLEVEVKLNSEYEEKIEEKKESYSVINNNKIELEEKFNNLKNIDSMTDSVKDEVFKLALELENKIIKKETDYKIAYLTFDDGPYYSTNDFLKVLKENDVKATFFTIGLNKERCYDNQLKECHSLYKKIVLDGHTIANHTYSHLIFNGLYSSSTSFINQVVKQEEFIKEKTGVITNIVRFPGGSSTAGNLKNDIIKGLREKKYGWVDWSAQDGDGGYLPNKDVAWNNFTNSINQNIEVVLFHDYNKITLSILPDAIKYLKDNNYILLPLFYESNMINK